MFIATKSIKDKERSVQKWLGRGGGEEKGNPLPSFFLPDTFYAFICMYTSNTHMHIHAHTKAM